MRQPHVRRPEEPPGESLAEALLAFGGVVLFALGVVLWWAAQAPAVAP
jgi:hypothetical protein